MSEETNIWKGIVLEFLDYLRYKVENGKLTMRETESMARTLESGLDLQGTVEDFSRFYGQSRTNVSSVINRRLFKKPVRRVYYSFNAFRKVVPERWKGHGKPTDNQRTEGNA
jgi:hypothetical protein